MHRVRAGGRSRRRRSARPPRRSRAITSLRRITSLPCAARKPAIPAPAYIRDRIDELGSAFNGRVGIAVKSIDEGWETGWKDHELYPQQSVSKLWVSITALDAVDRGRVSLDDKVTLTRADLTLFHQPIARRDASRTEAIRPRSTT